MEVRMKSSRPPKVPAIRRRRSRPRWPWLLALAIFVSTGSVAQAAELDGKRVAVKGAPAAGPSKYDQVWVRKYGPRDPGCVLVLSPGSPAGQGGFARIAPAMTQRVDGLAVWAIDRRPNALEDVSVFKRDRPRKSLDYYLFGGDVGGDFFEPVQGSAAGFVRDWGARTAVGDLRKVIQKASGDGNRCVMIGGHSFGTLLTQAYLAWDFNGTPGYKGLDGIVLIDGGLFNAFENVLTPAGYPEFTNVGQARSRIAKLQTQSPFGSDGSIQGLPSWVPGVVPEIVCQYALKHPNAISGLQKSTIGTRFLPGLPRVALTNEAFAGLFFEETAGDEGARLGRLSNRGNPLRWRDGRYSSVSRFCSTFTQEPGNGLEWYFPQRLMIEVTQGLEPLKQNAITDFLGLRPFHLADIDLPLYVIQTKLSDGGVLRAAHTFIRESKITRYKLVDDPDMDHTDPLVDYPKRNRFLKTVVPFLENTMRRSVANR
jgi:pimeloyl-ACP methyl ester carboxylesterase